MTPQAESTTKEDSKCEHFDAQSNLLQMISIAKSTNLYISTLNWDFVNSIT